MASSPSEQPSQGTTAPKALSQSPSRPGTGNNERASSPVEMRTIQQAPSDTIPPSLPTPEPSQSNVEPSASAVEAPVQPVQVQLDAQPPVDSKDMAPDSLPPPSMPESTAKPDLNRQDTEAIGPASDAPATKPDTSNGPVVLITLLLSTSGARHPYKIDEKYLRKRSVKVDNMDPYNISVYTLKELIWRDWREEWEARPTSPSSIRLIHFGRMLDDKAPLKECRFQNDAPNVVHMTIKPQEVVDEEDGKTGKDGRRRDNDEEQTAGCRCVIL